MPDGPCLVPITGGALYVQGGIVEVLSTRFVDNAARVLNRGSSTAFTAGGGAVMMRSVSSCRVGASQFESNQLLVNTTGSSYASRSRSSGGALYIRNSSCDLSSVAVSKNKIRNHYKGSGGFADAYGGGAYFDGTSGFTSIRLTSCQFTGNSIASVRGDIFGGAVGAVNLTLIIRTEGGDSLFSNNYINNSVSIDGDCIAWGGALSYEGASLAVSSTTFVGNSVATSASGVTSASVGGGAVHVYGSSSCGLYKGVYSFQQSQFTSNRASLTVRSITASGAAASAPVKVYGGAIRVNSKISGALNLTTSVFTRNSCYLKGISIHHAAAGGMSIEHPYKTSSI